MSRSALAAIGAFAVVLLGTVAFIYWPRSVKPTFTQSIVQGFTPFASFRASDPPGTVFRVNKAGAIFKVAELPVVIHSAQDVSGNIHATRKFSADQLLRIVGDTLSCSPVSAAFKPQAVGEVDVASVDGILEYTSDTEMDGSLAELRKMFAEKKLTYR